VVCLLAVAATGCPPHPKTLPAVAGVPWFDDFSPECEAPLLEVPRAADGSFPLDAGGSYHFSARSYCLDPWASGPGSDDPFVYDAFQGPFAPLIQAVLQGSTVHTDVASPDVQLLLWAIVSCEPIDSMNDTTQAAAREILSPAQLAQIDKNAASCPVATTASPALRSALTRRDPSLMMPAPAARSRKRPAAPASRATPRTARAGDAFPAGRWTFVDPGFFVSYAPFSYPLTEVRLYVPESFQVTRDTTGRIGSAVTAGGERLDLDYDPSIPPLEIPGDSGVKAYAVRHIRVRSRNPEDPRQLVDKTLLADFVLVGVPNGRGHAPSSPFPGLPARYAEESALSAELPLADPSAALFDMAAVSGAIRASADKDASSMSIAQRGVGSSYVFARYGEGGTAKGSGYHGGYGKSGTKGKQGEGVSNRSADDGDDYLILDAYEHALEHIQKGWEVLELFGEEGLSKITVLGEWIAEKNGIEIAHATPLGLAIVEVKSANENFHKIHEALRQDPPRSDYTTIAVPQPFMPVTVSASEVLNATRAANVNAFLSHQSAYMGALLAAQITQDRLGGARAAGDKTWARRQLRALLETKREAGVAMLLEADDIDKLIDEANADDFQNPPIDAEAAAKYQAALLAQGHFSAAAVSDAKQVGLDDADIAKMFHDITTADLTDLPASLEDALGEQRDTMRDEGARLAALPQADLSSLASAP
jgi:hypothetical protein